MTLTLAIPCCNDQDGLRRLAAQLPGLGCIAALAVYDDGSDRAVTPADCLPPGWAPDRLTLLRGDRRRGPGAARNALLDAVRTDHLLFFDADDLLTPELPHLMAALAGERFDFCLFRHADSRRTRADDWGEMPPDTAIWRATGLQGALAEARPDQIARLAETANFPWNKIYRTGFLRHHGIGCSEIFVHEDVALHWDSFLAAGRVLVSDRVVARHFVAEGGRRLTNRTGAERFDVLPVIDRLAARLLADMRQGLALPFLRFASGLADWIRGNLDPALVAEFDRRFRALLGLRLPRAGFAHVAWADPVLGRRLVRQMARGEPA